MTDSPMSGKSVRLIRPSDLSTHLWSREGWRCIVTISKAGVRQAFFKTDEEADDYALQMDQAEGVHVYHACATYQEPGNRKKENVWHVKAFWLDVDTGPGKGYEMTIEAWGHLHIFTARLGLPNPLVVASGTGFHVYFILQKPVTPDEWQRGSDSLKRACNAYGFRVDPARTGDVASILRPPGTRNKKSNPPAIVVGGGDNFCPIDYGQFLKSVEASIPINSSESGSRTGKGFISDPLTAAVGALYAPQPTDANKIADACPQMALFRDSLGNIPEPLWYAGICILAECDSGAETAHRWSSGYPLYSHEETERKLDHGKKDSGPTTCARFAALNPGLCQGCEHNGKITSPIQLGRDRPLNGTAIVETLPKPPFPYSYSGVALGFNTKDDAGAPIWKKIHPTPIIVTDFSANESGDGRNITLQHWLPHDGWATNVVNLQTTETKTLMSKLMNIGINVHEENARGVKKYLHSCIDAITAQRRTGMTYDQFGWKPGQAFLIGKTIIAGDKGEGIEVPIAAEIALRAGMMDPRGSYSGWAAAANQLFQIGFEGQALSLLCSFAAPLMRFLRSAGGCIVHQVSPTGQGKTVGLRAAWTVWGGEHSLDLNRVDTQNARFREIALIANLPIIFDELRNRDPSFTKEFILSFTDGREKNRLNREGKMIHLRSGWSTIIISASNESLTQSVMTEGEHAQAARILEYHSSLPKDVDNKKGQALERAFEQNRGQAGRRFMAGIVQPKIYDWCSEALEKWNAEYLTQLGAGTEHRFYAATLACIKVAGELLNTWEMLEFEVDRMIEFAMNAAKTNRRMILDALPDYPRILQRFLLTNLRSTLVVEQDPRFDSTAEPLVKPTADMLCVRIERREGFAYIDREQARDWCTKNHVEFTQMEKELQKEDILVSNTFQKNLGSGTAYGAAGAVRCWRVNLVHRGLGQLELLKGGFRFDSEEERDAREGL